MDNLMFPIEELGNNGFRVLVDLNLYSSDAITATCYKYTSQYYIHQQILPSNNMLVEVTFEVKDDATSIVKNDVKQFCNDLLDQQVRCIVNKDFGHIRDLIVEEAFKPVNN